MMFAMFERPLTPEEAKKVRAFYIEARTTALNSYLLNDFRIVVGVDEYAIHLRGPFEPFFEVGEFDNYNIGWRAWLTLPSDDLRKQFAWLPVKKCKGIGYGWEYNRNLIPDDKAT